MADEIVQSPTMHLDRVGKFTFRARNENGAEVLVGPEAVPGSFTPGELLKIALAACNGMSADHRLAHAFGDEVDARITIETLKNESRERYEEFTVSVAVPLRDLTDEARARLETRAEESVRKNCTVGRTLEFGPSYQFRLADDAPDAGGEHTQSVGEDSTSGE